MLTNGKLTAYTSKIADVEFHHQSKVERLLSKIFDKTDFSKTRKGL